MDKRIEQINQWNWRQLEERYGIFQKEYDNSEQYDKINKERIWEEIRKGENR